MGSEDATVQRVNVEAGNAHALLLDMNVTQMFAGIAGLAETVIYRIFYYVNRSGNGHLTLRELKRGNLIAAMQHADEEEDINKVLRFKCIDLDGNGVLTANEMQFFNEEQLHRMECMAQELVVFEDILCQIVDMIGPENESYITLRDLKGFKLSGNIFNILFNP